MRINPKTGELSGYYRLIESYRDESAEVRKRTLLTAGFLDDLSGDELHLIQTRLTERAMGMPETLFSPFDSEKVCAYVDRFYHQMVSEKKIDASSDKIATNICWQIKNEEALKESEGVYFLKTSLNPEDEETVWKIYNTIREIEYTFRVLKTDLDLRPIYHKKDESTMAHLHLGLLAYWLVNTIRYQLKSKKIKSEWREIVRIANTQKMLTTTAINTRGEEVWIRRCSEPEQKIKELFLALNQKFYPFTRKKSVVLKIEPENLKQTDFQHLSG